MIKKEDLDRAVETLRSYNKEFLQGPKDIRLYGWKEKEPSKEEWLLPPTPEDEEARALYEVQQLRLQGIQAKPVIKRDEKGHYHIEVVLPK